MNIGEIGLGEYWRHRDLQQSPDYEDRYWGTVVDPDGIVRVRSEERDRHIEDVKTELGFINALPGGKLLDVGCGLGFFLSGVGRQWERHGVEISAFAAERAREYGAIHVGKLAEISFPDGYFDAVVCHHVIEHVPDPAPFLQEIRRILRPEGTLVLGTPDFDSGCARRFGERYRLLHDPTHVSLFSADSMRRFLRDNGFRIERVDFPFFESRYFTAENLLRLFDTSRVSPPFYGNFMTLYCSRLPNISVSLSQVAASLSIASQESATELSHAAEMLARVAVERRTVFVVPGSDTDRWCADVVARELSAPLTESAGVRERMSLGDMVVVVGRPAAELVTAAKACGARSIVFRTHADEALDGGDVIIDASRIPHGTRAVFLTTLLSAIRDGGGQARHARVPR